LYQQIIKRHAKLIASIIAIVLTAFIPVLVHSPYYLGLFITMIVYAILAMTFVLMLRTGLINLAVVAFWGLGAYVSAVLVMKLHLSFWLSLPACAIITGVVAWGFSFILMRRGSGGFAFVIFSAVIGMLFSVTVGHIEAIGGYNGLPYIPPPNPINIPFLPTIVFDSKVQFFYLALTLLVVVILILKAFYSSSIGRAWTSIGLNPRLAESLGVNVFRYKMLSFVVASAICGLAGSFYAHYIGFLTPTNFTIWQSIYVQIYAILGGIGYSILGPLLGSVVVVYIPEATRISSLMSPLFVGAILILMILFLPSGLLGLLQWRSQIVERIKWIGRRIDSFRLLQKSVKK
jgi:branched-chain amino acid transport system permease protein